MCFACGQVGVARWEGRATCGRAAIYSVSVARPAEPTRPPLDLRPQSLVERVAQADGTLHDEREVLFVDQHKVMPCVTDGAHEVVDHGLVVSRH